MICHSVSHHQAVCLSKCWYTIPKTNFALWFERPYHQFKERTTPTTVNQQLGLGQEWKWEPFDSTQETATRLVVAKGIYSSPYDDRSRYGISRRNRSDLPIWNSPILRWFWNVWSQFSLYTRMPSCMCSLESKSCSPFVYSTMFSSVSRSIPATSPIKNSNATCLATWSNVGLGKPFGKCLWQYR